MSDYKDWINQNLLTIVESVFLHFCLEYREVEVAGQIVELTAKEFDILAQLSQPRLHEVSKPFCLLRLKE